MYILFSHGPMNIIFPPLRLALRTRNAVGATPLAGRGCGLYIKGRRRLLISHSDIGAFCPLFAGKMRPYFCSHLAPRHDMEDPRPVKKTHLTGLSADPYWSANGQYLAERDAINHFTFFLIWDKLVKHWTRGAFEKGPSLLAR